MLYSAGEKACLDRDKRFWRAQAQTASELSRLTYLITLTNGAVELKNKSPQFYNGCVLVVAQASVSGQP